MINRILTQSTLIRFSFSVYNPENGDTETSTAVFLNPPSSEDWQEWLHDWNTLGYQLLGKPIQTT